jgi:hypothetical protein
MTDLPELPQINIVGPFWSAEADVLRLPEPERAWAFRELFVDLSPEATRAKVLLPGTLIVLCWVRTLRVTPKASQRPSYQFARSSRANPPSGNLTIADLQRLVRDGTLSLLLVQADPRQWKDRDPAQLGTLTCLAGHISIDALRGQTRPRTELYRALDLVEASLGTREGPAALPAALSAHASGLTLYGSARLPWQTERVTAPYQLARVVPAPVEKGTERSLYRLTVETERLTPSEREAFTSAWVRLASSIDPGNPAWDIATPFAPRWVTLEVANPRAIPRMHWQVEAWQAQPASLPLHLAGEELSLVFSDQALFDRAQPATSLARTVLDDVIIARSQPSAAQPAILTLDVRAARRGVVTPLAGRLGYAAGVEGPSWGETFRVSGVPTAYHPADTARLVRDVQELPAPDWAAGSAATPVEPPVLWAFLPLEDGWVQLPIPNLTEQMYLDAQLTGGQGSSDPVASAPGAATSLLSGAVAYGNDKPGALTHFRNEHPWGLTLLDADRITGVWRLTQASASEPFALAHIELELTGPELTLDGFVWIATGRPSAEDALPTLDDWMGGLRPVSLRSVDPLLDALPPLATVLVSELTFGSRSAAEVAPSAALGAWSASFGADAAVFEKMVARKLLPRDTFARALPLVWRRHRTLPMIQALPLTQSRAPANYPSASRQLVPFELPVRSDSATHLLVPSDWLIGRPAGSAASAWPLARGEAVPAREWASAFDLPLVALSLPGLILDPTADRTGLPPDAGTGLPQQYRHDLPYADEAHALAQLPKVPRPPEEVSPLPASLRPEPPKPLTRDALAGHFQRLSERASLAAADAVAATAAATDGTHIRSLIEPLVWAVSATIDTDSYPGTLTFANAAGAPAAAAVLEGESALAGIDGSFVEGAGGLVHLSPEPTDGAYAIVAGSMAAHANGDGSFRDQRGLQRGATRVRTAAHVLRTPLELAGEAESFELVSLLEPIPLHVSPVATGSSAAPWRLWFRDLPVSSDAFARNRTRSALAQDVNDPEAGSRTLGYLNGWEWRLEPPPKSPFKLFGLDFFPLTIERVAFAGDSVREVQIVGRLQLPLKGSSAALEELANAVRLTFGWDGPSERLALSAVAAESAACEWPLEAPGPQLADAPRLEWNQISLVPLRDRIELGGARVVFQLFGADFRIPLEGVSFAAVPTAFERSYVSTGASASEALTPRALDLRIDPVSLEHGLSLLLGVRLARSITTLPPGPRPTPLTWRPSALTPGVLPPAEASRTAFVAQIRFPLIGAESGAAQLESGFLFDDLKLQFQPASPVPASAEPSLLVGECTLQVRWSGYALQGGGRLQLLPGMDVATGNSPGFAALTFRVVTAANDVPTLPVVSSFTEAIVRCSWGEPLQTAPSSTPLSLGRVFGSSAGDVMFGFTAESREANWDEQYLLNGFLEVKDLISWPRAMSVDASRACLTLPSVRSAASLDHLRHTVRVLLDQHSIPSGILEPSPGELLFRLAPDKGWQFLAVVEHQLAEVLPGVEFSAPVIQNDRRWVAVQEVRWLRPASLKAQLLDLERDRLRLQSPTGGSERIGKAAYSYLGSGLRALLAEGNAPALDALHPDSLLVEASAIHWLDERTTRVSAPTALQYLPSGTQLASLSRPEDYAPTDPLDPAWSLLQVPFLGRLQQQARDAIEPPVAGGAGLLALDPVLNLQRRRSSAAALPPLLLALTAWADTRAETVIFSSLDAAIGRTWGRLEPIALEESWYFMQNPAREALPAGLGSVLTALPDTPARLGRPATLAVLFDGMRTAYPPGVHASSSGIPADIASDTPVWRPEHLHVLQAVSSVDPASSSPPYGWLATALQLSTGLLARATTPSSTPRYHVAATALPLHLRDAPVPSALAVSPFLALEFRPAPAEEQTELRVVVAELLSHDAASGRLRPVASQSWELGRDDSPPQRPRTRLRVRELAAAWARATHRRLSPESPFAVLRFRELRQNVSTDEAALATQAVLVTSYDFALVSGLERAPRLAQRVFRLRAPVSQLRFRDGRFGGQEAPKSVHSFELAPPQTHGVQPLYLAARPDAETIEATWPWGFSALRTSVRYTHEAEGAVGRGAELGLWWQSLQHAVQFRSALSAEPAAGLPPLFRASAIRSLLPVLPDPPLPALDAPPLGVPDPLGAPSQPVLPGSLRTTLVGARPGVFLALRAQLMRQSDNDPTSAEQRPSGRVLVSGSLPVQHRVPRPVPLPANSAAGRDVALRTWASFFEPELGLVARGSPIDEAFFAPFASESAHRLQMKIVEPPHGEITSEWNGTISADIELDGPSARIEDWQLALRITHAGRTVRYPAQAPASGGPGRFVFELASGSPELAMLRELLDELMPGAVLVASARLSRARGAEGFGQLLSFPFRLVDPKALRLPLEPFFILFEDPEYNRQLASSSMHASGFVKTLEGGQRTLHTLTLATDRTEYDPDAEMAFRYDWDDGTSPHTADLDIDLVDATGIRRPLELRVGDQRERTLSLSAGTLRQIALRDLLDRGETIQFAAGQSLVLTLTIIPGGGVLELAEIVGSVSLTPAVVIPASPAAYALLRWQLIDGHPQVECVRFAWCPRASRVELVCPDDLRTQIVRRRAVFLWTDTARLGTATGYAVQKISGNGATHLPDPEIIERIG